MKYYSDELKTLFNTEGELKAAEQKAAERQKAQEEKAKQEKEEAEKLMKQEEEEANVLICEIRTVLEHIDAYNKKYHSSDVSDFLTFLTNLF